MTDKFASMPPHPEVPAALGRLRDHGFRLFTLTDNLLETKADSLEQGGIIDLFERRFSVDQEVRRHKPAGSLRLCRPSPGRAAPADVHDRLPYLGYSYAVAAGQAALIKRVGNET